MSELTIKREDLIEIATEALAKTDGLTNDEKLNLCETAHTMKSVLSGNWVTPTCGCLVGTLYRSQFTEAQIASADVDMTTIGRMFGDSTERLGCTFDELLDEHFDYELPMNSEIKVID